MSPSDAPNNSADSGKRETEGDAWSTEEVSAAAEESVEAATEEEAEPKKKRYYSPNEVMKKKGCIGCGGMALAAIVVPCLMAVLLAIL
jgi:hypothetical protein